MRYKDPSVMVAHTRLITKGKTPMEVRALKAYINKCHKRGIPNPNLYGHRKVCFKCNKHKLAKDFDRSKRFLFGLGSVCKLCERNRSFRKYHNWTPPTPEEVLQKKKQERAERLDAQKCETAIRRLDRLQQMKFFREKRREERKELKERVKEFKEGVVGVWWFKEEDWVETDFADIVFNNHFGLEPRTLKSLCKFMESVGYKVDESKLPKPVNLRRLVYPRRKAAPVLPP